MSDTPAQSGVVLDLFAGPGGWDVAAAHLGLDPIGVEWDAAACDTARAAGFVRHQQDVAELDPLTFVEQVAGGQPVWGLVASPPCQAFSLAGKGHGRAGAPVLLDGVARIGAGEDPRAVAKDVDSRLADPRAALVLEPLRWALELEPEWIALEQVPPVLPLWEAIAEVLRQDGWNTDTGCLQGEQYDVPQTRKRAFLVAHRERVVQLPAPVRRKYRKGTAQDQLHRLDDASLLPWISMAQALGWAGDDLVGFPRRDDGRESITIDGADYRARDLRPGELPAQVVTEKARSWSRWQYVNGTHARAGVRDPEDPAPTVMFGDRLNGVTWQMRANNMGRAAVRDADQPSPTIAAGNSTASRVWQHVSSGRTAEGRPRELDEPAGTVTTKGTGYFIPEGTWREDQAELPAMTKAQGAGMVERHGKRPDREADEPAFTVTAATGGGSERLRWTGDRPATTVQGDARVWPPGHKLNADDLRRDPDAAQKYGDRAGTKAVRVSIAEAAVLQGFPVDYPWHGTATAQYRQVGDAVPPPLAWHVLRAAIGTDQEEQG